MIDELPPALRRNVLLMKEKVPSGASLEDAETLPAYAMLTRTAIKYNEFAEGAME